MVKRHAPSPFILSICPFCCPASPCIPLSLLYPNTFFKEMRYNLQGSSCLAFSDNILMAAQGPLHSYTTFQMNWRLDTVSHHACLDGAQGQVGYSLHGRWLRSEAQPVAHSSSLATHGTAMEVMLPGRAEGRGGSSTSVQIVL